MPFTFEEKCFNKVFRQEKGWGAKRICSEFREKKWAVSSVNDLLRKIDKTGSVERKVSSGRPRSIRTQRIILRVNSPELNPVTRLSGELCSRACIAFQFPTWTILKTECALAGRGLTNRSSTSSLISGVTD